MRISDWSSDVCSSDLVPLGARCTLGPRVLLQEALGMKEARPQRFPSCRVLDDALLDIIQPNALHPSGGEIEITGLLTVKLNDGRAIFDGFLLRLYFAENIRSSHVNADFPADIQIVAGNYQNYTNVLDR